ncbi:MAG: nitrate reductase [Planctomycetes bacterium]|nr:nitrate reductase [Planctomycetota bacterium]
MKLGPNLGPARGGGAGRARELKAWAREALGLDDDVTILVSELTCTEPGCPPIETVFAILRGPGQQEQRKVHKPMSEVTREDVLALARGDHHHPHHDTPE